MPSRWCMHYLTKIIQILKRMVIMWQESHGICRHTGLFHFKSPYCILFCFICSPSSWLLHWFVGNGVADLTVVMTNSRTHNKSCTCYLKLVICICFSTILLTHRQTKQDENMSFAIGTGKWRESSHVWETPRYINDDWPVWHRVMPYVLVWYSTDIVWWDA